MKDITKIIISIVIIFISIILCVLFIYKLSNTLNNVKIEGSVIKNENCGGKGGSGGNIDFFISSNVTTLNDGSKIEVISGKGGDGGNCVNYQVTNNFKDIKNGSVNK